MTLLAISTQQIFSTDEMPPPITYGGSATLPIRTKPKPKRSQLVKNSTLSTSILTPLLFLALVTSVRGEGVPPCHIYFGYCHRRWQTKMQCRCNLENLLRATMPSNTFHYRALGCPRHTSQSLGQRLTTIRLTHTMSSAIVQSLRVWPYQQVFTTNNTTDNVLSDGAADASIITRNQGTATPARNAGTSSAKSATSSGTTSSTLDRNSTSTTTSSASPHLHT